MGWKEFFKPTVAKVIITVALFAIFIFAPIIPSSICSKMGMCEPGTTSIWSGAYGLISNSSFFMHAGFISALILFGVLILTYLFSCAIVIVYNKVMFITK